jgi:hypothetical protein
MSGTALCGCYTRILYGSGVDVLCSWYTSLHGPWTDVVLLNAEQTSRLSPQRGIGD